MDTFFGFLEKHDIYIVMVIVLVIWVTLFLYLYRLDKRIKKLERRK